MTAMILLFALLGIGLVGLFALIRLLKRGEKLKWRALRSTFFRMPSFRFSMLFLALLYTGLFSIGYLYFENQTASVTLSLNYDEAYKGLNANGTRYNMSDIVSVEVAQRAIELGALENVTARELVDCLSVKPLVEGDSFNQKKYHISTEYLVSFTANEKTAHLDARNVAALIGAAYKECYIETHLDNFATLNDAIAPTEDFTGVEYMDIADALSYRVQRVQGYLYAMADANRSFISSKGESFLSLAARCGDLDDIQITGNLKAYLQQNGIAKNAAKYVDRLEFDNERYDLQYQGLRKVFDISNEAVEMYDEEMTRIVLIPTWDNDGQYYMGRTKVGIDKLSLDAGASSQNAAEYLELIENNNLFIANLLSSAGDGENVYVETMIERISSEISTLAAQAKEIGIEYMQEKMNGCISISAREHSFGMFVIFAAAVFGLFYYVACAFCAAKRTKKG